MRHLAIPPPGNIRSLLFVGGVVCTVAVVLCLMGLDLFDIMELIVLVIISIRPAKDRTTDASREEDGRGNGNDQNS